MNRELNEEFFIEAENNIKDRLTEIDKNEEYFSRKVLDAFKEYDLNDSDFVGTTGYGYSDYGRDKIEKIFAKVLGAEAGLVRNQFISGTHALTVTFFGLLRPNNLLLSISGKPYDTLDEVIGIKENNSSLKSFGINFDYIDLINNDFDYDKIEKYIKENKVDVIEIQRSRGYSSRDAISIDKVKKVTKLIKDINKDIVIMVDNCYCEFVERETPMDVGCDIMVGSLIKNLGAGIAENGAYVVGREDLINKVSERLTVPGQGMEVGPSQNANKLFAKGLYMAPSVVASALKTSLFLASCLDLLNIECNPKVSDKQVDIVEAIIFRDKDKLIKFVQGIGKYSAVGSNSKPIPSPMPGYDNEIIMASGSFTQGSSIEISCDGPIREPYIAYFQGSLTYNYGKIAVKEALRGLYE